MSDYGVFDEKYVNEDKWTIEKFFTKSNESIHRHGHNRVKTLNLIDAIHE